MYHTQQSRTLWRSKPGEVLIEHIQYYNANGQRGFEPFTRARLKKSADAVRALAKRSAG